MSKGTPASIPIAMLLASASFAQQEPAPTDGVRLLEHVRQGNDLAAFTYRRGDDGRLEFLHAADEAPEFAPLVQHLDDGGPLPWCWLFGSGDLLSLTDAAFHFRCLGIDASDIGLRQLVVVEPEAAGAGMRRARALDRELAVEELCRRRCKGAVAEFQAVSDRDDVAPALRERCRRGLAVLRGGVAERPRLDPALLPLPTVFDAAILIDHAALPDQQWLVAALRRLGLLISARAFADAGGEVSPTLTGMAQRMADATGELPFDTVLRYGNVRLDHSCVTLRVVVDGDMPLAFQAATVGAFDGDRWRPALAEFAKDVRRHVPGFRVEVDDDRLQLASDDGNYRPRPEAAGELLADTGAAIRVVVPTGSRIWPLLATLRLPPATGLELRFMVAERSTVELRVTARDEDAAEAWIARIDEVLLAARAGLPPQLRQGLLERPTLAALAEAVFVAECTTADREARAVVAVPALGHDDWASLLQLLVESLGG
ncbi:MAG: hypothetical protein AB7O97_21390 [Planctomycetota bacterium]